MPAQDKNPAIAMAMALALQLSINDEDLKWLRNRNGLGEKTRNEVFDRMVTRGGRFLTLIEKSVGFNPNAYKPEWFDEVYARIEAGKYEWIKDIADANRANTKGSMSKRAVSAVPLQLNVSTEANRAIEKLQSKLGNVSKTEVVRLGLGVLGWVVEELEQNHQIMVQRQPGIAQVLGFPYLNVKPTNSRK